MGRVRVWLSKEISSFPLVGEVGWKKQWKQTQRNPEGGRGAISPGLGDFPGLMNTLYLVLKFLNNSQHLY